MTVTLSLHEADGQADSLLEHLLEACRGADRGGGVFAWANRPGVRALLEHPDFVAFADDAIFDLVVGMDSITDEAALNLLMERSAAQSNISVRAFVHDLRPLFHPKLSWFGKGSAITLIVGSGNLTRGGLESNWEACVIAELDGSAAADVEAKLSDWLSLWDKELLPLDHPKVRKCAQANRGREREFRNLRSRPPVADAGLDPAATVLVAEIGGGARWKQGDFTKEILTKFFGYTGPDSERWINLLLVHSDGTTVGPNAVKVFRVKSSNYRAELAGIQGSYPLEGAPIGVYARVTEDDYRYVLVRPNDDGHSLLADYLDSNRLGGPKSRQRRLTTVAEISVVWPDAPLWSPDAV